VTAQWVGFAGHRAGRRFAALARTSRYGRRRLEETLRAGDSGSALATRSDSGSSQRESCAAAWGTQPGVRPSGAGVECRLLRWHRWRGATRSDICHRGWPDRPERLRRPRRPWPPPAVPPVAPPAGSPRRRPAPRQGKLHRRRAAPPAPADAPTLSTLPRRFRITARKREWSDGSASLAPASMS
jgi:hypothetical protein